MQRRIGVDGFELFGVVGGAIVGGPAPADSKFVKAQHVHYADRRQCGAIEVGALGEAGADQQATVAAAPNGQIGRVSVMVGDEPLRCSDEVIEHVLLVQLSTCEMPLFAILAPTTQVWL